MRRTSLEDAERKLKAIAAAMMAEMPGWGFILILASTGKERKLTYLFSIPRDDAVRLLKEWIMRVSPGGDADAPGFVNRTQAECYCCETRDDLILVDGPLRVIQLCRRCWQSVSEVM